jgi:hypothetical protein
VATRAKGGYQGAAACNSTMVQKGGSRLYGLIRSVAVALLLLGTMKRLEDDNITVSPLGGLS